MAIEEYTEEIEDIFLQVLYTDPETFVRVKNITSSKFFDDPDNRKIVQFLMDYTDEHSALPKDEVIKAVTVKSIEKIDDYDTETADWFMNEYERFCQQKAAKQAVLDGMDLIKEHKLAEIVDRVKAAAELGIVKDLGVD